MVKPVWLLVGTGTFAAALLAWSARGPATAERRYPSYTTAAPSVSVLAVRPQAPMVSASGDGTMATSPETTRLEQRRELYASVDALLQASEFERARRLLDEDQERHGDELQPEWRDLALGYRLLADCLEQPSARHRTRGQAFLLVNEATALNARLRAACAPK